MCLLSQVSVEKAVTIFSHWNQVQIHEALSPGLLSPENLPQQDYDKYIQGC
jgi:hypothetical protein